MPCPRCGFFNMPGTDLCISCGGPLAAAQAGASGGVALAPPRAATWRKVVGRSSSVVPESARVRAFPARLASVALPGLPFFREGRRVVGWAVLLVWFLFLALGGFYYATFLGGSFWWSACSVHLTSAMWPYRPALSAYGWKMRTAISLGAYLLLVGLVYLPLLRAVERRVEPVQLPSYAGTHERAPVQAGDTILLRRHGSGWLPRRGVIIAARFLGGVVSIDRVVGVAGDRMSVRGGALLRNGIPVPEEEGVLSPSWGFPEGEEAQVPPGSVFVWPSQGIVGHSAVNIKVFLRQSWPISVVTPDRIVGEAWRIAAPWARRGPVAAAGAK